MKTRAVTVFGLFWIVSLWGQDPDAEPAATETQLKEDVEEATGEATPASPVEEEPPLRKRLAELKVRVESLGAEEGARIQPLLAEAEKDLTEAAVNADRLRWEKANIDAFDRRLAEIEAREAEVESGSSVPEALSAPELEARLADVRGQLDTRRKRIEVLNARSESFGFATGSAAEKLVELQGQLTAMEELLRTPPVADTIDAEVQRLANEAERSRLQTAIHLLRFTLQHQDKLSELIRRELNVETAAVAALTERESRLRDRRQELRQLATRERREELERAAEAVAADDPVRLAYAERTAELARELEEITRLQSDLIRKLAETNQTSKRLTTDYETLRKQVENFGSSVAVGRLLLLRRGEVLQGSRSIGALSETKENLTQVTERRIDLQIGAEGNALRQRPPGVSEGGELFENRMRVLSELTRTYQDYAVLLTNLLAAQLQLQENLTRFSSALDGWLIGTRTSRRLGLGDVPGMFGEMVSASEGTLRKRGNDLLEVLREKGAELLTLTALVAFLIPLRRPIERSGNRIRDRMRKVRTDRFWFPLVEVLSALVRCLPIPLLIFGLGWLMDGSTRLDSASGPGFSFRFAGLTLYGLLLVADVGREKGLGPVHLKWNREWCLHYRRELRYFTPIMVVLGFLANGSVTVANERGLEEVRGYIFLILILFLVFGLRLLRSGSRWMDAEASRPNSWIVRRRQWVRIALVLLVVAGCYALVMGYGYTVGVMIQEFGKSVFVVIGLILIRGIVERSLSLSNRKLRFQQSLKRLEQSRERSLKEGSNEGNEVPQFEEESLDLHELGEKASRLVGAVFVTVLIFSLWSIWTQSVPLFETLDGVALPYSKTVEVGGVVQTVPLTISDLVLSLLILLLTIAATINLPGLLEIAVLPLFSLDRGARYAIATLTQYAILAIGLFLVFSQLGFEWSSIQWLVAALGVGLGFGLQEIVANFVSGIIILFERPVRVGDLVTVGDTSGVVSKIRIRATTILNWDKQELLVPNKEFITGRLLNWTLSDPLNRVVIPIGVAYGTDTRKALEVLGKVAEEHPMILDDPAPLLTFEGFGDSSLNLVLRCYLKNYDGRLDIMTELHHRVHEAFAEAGIEIAFPQLDLHIKDPVKK